MWLQLRGTKLWDSHTWARLLLLVFTKKSRNCSFSLHVFEHVCCSYSRGSAGFGASSRSWICSCDSLQKIWIWIITDVLDWAEVITGRRKVRQIFLSAPSNTYRGLFDVTVDLSPWMKKIRRLCKMLIMTEFSCYISFLCAKGPLPCWLWKSMF